MKSILLHLLHSKVFRTCFKAGAIIKYAFFPFLMVESQGVDFNALLHNQFITAKVETENAVWIATNNGLWEITKDHQHVLHLTETNSVLPSNHVTGITSTSNGDVYATTDNGIFRYDGYAFLVINSENTALPEVKLTSIACDKNDNLWIGTQGKGLVLMQDYHIKLFNHSNSPLSTDEVDTITPDTDGSLHVTLMNQEEIKISERGMSPINEPSSQGNELAKKN